jgi:hypothetical protein
MDCVEMNIFSVPHTTLVNMQDYCRNATEVMLLKSVTDYPQKVQVYEFIVTMLEQNSVA